MGLAARASAERFAWPRVASRIERVYERAVDLPAPADPVARGFRADRARAGRRAAAGPREAAAVPRAGSRRSSARAAAGWPAASASASRALVGVGLTYLAARRIGVDNVVESAVRSDLAWILVATALMCASMFFRAGAWLLAARSALPGFSLRRRDFTSATMIGVLMSATLPARLGEPARAMIISRRIGRFRETFPVLLGTLVSQTALNIVALVLLGVVIVSSTDLFSRSSEHLFLVSLAPALLLIAVVAAPALVRRSGSGRIARLAAMAPRRPRPGPVRAGRLPRPPPRAARRRCRSLTAWAIQVAACFALAVAMGLDDAMGIGGAAAVLFAVNVTAVVPATPSNIGVFQLAVISVLTTGYGVGAADALAYGVILQAVEIATAVGLGLPALVREGMSWSDVRLRALSAAPVRLQPQAARGERRARASPAEPVRRRRPRRPRYPCIRPSRAAEGPGPRRRRNRRSSPRPAKHGATAGTDGGTPITPFDYEQTGTRHPRRRAASGSSSSTAAWAPRSSTTSSRAEDYGGLPGKCHEALVLHRPDVIAGVHEEMLEAGAEVLETDSFQGSRLKLEEWGLGDQTVEINRRAAEIAREAAGTDRFVAGSIGPTGFLPASDDPTLGDISFARLAEVFDEQAGALVEGGADLLIIETAQDILEVRGGDRRRPRGLQAGRARRSRSRSRSRCCRTAARCSSAPTSRRCSRSSGHEGRHRRTQLLDRPRGHAGRDPLPRRELAACPSTASRTPGLPVQGPDGETIFPETPEQLARVLGEFVERHGVGLVGGCCGTTPEHIAAIVERVGGPRPRGRDRARARRGSRA